MQNVKIKILADVDCVALTSCVNEFIKDKDIIDIKYESLLVAMNESAAVNDRVMIIYKEA